MNKIAVLADIHGNLIALEKVMQDLRPRGVDLVVNLGDHVSGPLWPKETLSFLKQRDWVHIRGNHDRQLVTQQVEDMGESDRYARRTLESNDLEWLAALPPRAELGGGMVLFHGTPEDDDRYLLETVENGRARLAAPSEIDQRLGSETAPIILCGHSHIPRLVKVSPTQLVINPGSVGLPAYDDVIPEPHVMECGSPHARYAVLERDGGDWRVEMIAVTYDYQQAAEQARKNRREDWAFGLLTGFMDPGEIE